MSLVDFTGFEEGTTTPSNPDNGGAWSIVSASSVTLTGGRTGSFGLLFGSNNGTIGAEGLARDLVAAEEHATIIMGACVQRISTATTTNGCIFGFCSDAGATTHITIQYDQAGTIRVYRGTTAGTLLGSSASPVFIDATLHYVEATVTLSDTVGVIEVKVDGVVVITLTSQDTKNAGTKTVFDRVVFGRGASAGNRHMIDDCYIVRVDGSGVNTYMDAPRIYGVTPNADGSSSQFVGSDGNSVNNYLLVDEVPPSLTDYVEDSTSGHRDLYNISSVAWATSDTPQGVRLGSIVQNTDASTRNIKLGVKSGGTVNMGAGQSIGVGSATRLGRVLPLNPVTATGWTQADIDALEIGVEVV